MTKNSASQSLFLLGSTGSIGQSTLDVVRLHPDRFRVFALAAQRRIELLLPQILEFSPRYAVVSDPDAGRELQRQLRDLNHVTKVWIGPDALVDLAQDAEIDTVLAAIVGAAGLRSTLAAAEAGKKILLANKEALVLAGHLFIQTVQNHGAVLIPIDSEHNAIFQCLPAPFYAGKAPLGVRRAILTASGGPFRERPLQELAKITPAEACRHPNWSMGPKISVDSATMMNKGLELIEAHWLFGLSAQQIEVLIHPQSIIHSMVEYEDGSVLAQLGNPDMKTPIANALAYPDRIPTGGSWLDLANAPALQFMKPDLCRFPALRLAYEALATLGSACAYLNAANEVAVASFLRGEIGFPRIVATVDAVLQRLPEQPMTSLGEILAADQCARRAAVEYLGIQR